MLQDKGHCWLGRTCRTGAFLGAACYLLPYCICRTLSALLCKSHVTGFGLFVNLPEACEFPTCPSACHSHCRLQHPAVRLSVPRQTPFEKLRVQGCPHAAAMGMGILLPCLPYCAGTGGCCLPASRLCLRSALGTGGLPFRTRFSILWSTVSYHSGTKQPWFQFYFPLAQGVVSYSWRCFFFLIILC